MPQHDNFKQDAAPVVRTAKLTREFTHLILACSSIFLIYNATFNFCQSNDYHWLICAILPNLSCIGAYFAIDHALKVYLPFAIRYLVTGRAIKKKYSRGRKMMSILTVIVVFLQLGLTTVVSLWFSPIFSDQLNEKPETEQYTELALSNDQIYAENREIITGQIGEAKQTEKKRIRDAKRQGHSLVKSAITSKGSKMAKLYYEGNSWAAGKLRKAIKKARQDSTNLVLEQQNLVSSLQNQQLAFISNSSRDSISTTLAGVTGFLMSDYEKTKSTYSRLISLLMIVCAVFLIFSVFIIVIYENETNLTVIDGNKITLSKLLSRAGNQKWQTALEEKAKSWGVNFQSSPVLATLSSGGTQRQNLPDRQRQTEVKNAVSRLPDAKQSTETELPSSQTEIKSLNRPAKNRTFEDRDRVAKSDEIERIKRRVRERYKSHLKHIGTDKQKAKTDMYLEDKHYLESSGFTIHEIKQEKKLRIEVS